MKERVATARAALATLDAVLAEDASDPIVRDALIKRFEYTYEAVLKAAQHEFVRRGIPLVGPKPIVREAFRAGHLTEADTERALQMVDDRNASVHTYDESRASELARRIPAHAAVLRSWIEGLERLA